ncbi:MAG: hypothetical protein H6807_01125 [Planctomycetes bacterium]|nr:hypothetical protein [Planctomycetota bacterium]
MNLRNVLAAVGLLALGCVLGGAGGLGRATESRPMVIQKGATITTVDRQSGSPNPISYVIEDADGPWLRVSLLKKSAKKKGDPFWIKVDDIGAFVVE